MKIFERRPNYYYIRIRKQKDDTDYHDVIIRFSDIPNSQYTPFPSAYYERYVKNVFEAYCESKYYYYCALWVKYGNYHGIIAEKYSDMENVLLYENFEETKIYLEAINV